MTAPGTRLLLLRHGEVASHRGDVPVTEAGIEHARRTGRALGAAINGPIIVMYGGTRRTRETAEAIITGIGDAARIAGPHDAFALRNPDMYVAGSRVNMVSSAEALAEQIPGMSTDEAGSIGWWNEFFDSSDRIGWWLTHDDPPGETVGELTARVLKFARSLNDPGPTRGRTVLAVTHSPLLRAVLHHATGDDPGEPAYVTGAEIVRDGGDLRINPHDPLD